MELSEQMKKKIELIVENITLEMAEKIKARRSAAASPPQPPASPASQLKNPVLQKLLQELLEEDETTPKRGGSR